LEERWRQLWDPRPACVVPLTPGLARRPGWLALIALFFSRPRLRLWARVGLGILLGLACDSLTGNSDLLWLDRL